MMNKIRVFWYQHPDGYGNFGDELNPYLIEKLSGKKVYFINIHDLVNPSFLALKMLVHDIFVKKVSLKKISVLPSWVSLFKIQVIVSIGSVINQFRYGNIKVWGSGIISKKDDIYPAKFLAVRGKYSQERLKQLGLKLPEIIGDPALLLPLVFKPQVQKKYKFGLIPHYVHYSHFVKEYSREEILIINLLDPIEKIIDEINSCQCTFSTSLHGIIVSQAYQIPSLWINTNTTERLSGDDIKFFDYFSSVEIKEYTPIDFPNTISLEDLYRIKETYVTYILPKKEIVNKIQKMLLSITPFPLLNSIKQDVKIS